jgi:hypothetical protein
LGSTRRFSDHFRPIEPHTGDAPFVAIDDFDLPAAFPMHKHIADCWHLASYNKGKATDRVDILVDLGQFGVEFVGQVIKFGAGIGFPDAG